MQQLRRSRLPQKQQELVRDIVPRLETSETTQFAELLLCIKDTTQCTNFLHDILLQDTRQQRMQQLRRIRPPQKQPELVRNIILLTEASANYTICITFALYKKYKTMYDVFDVLLQDTRQQRMQQLRRTRLPQKQQELVRNIVCLWS